MQGLIVRLSPFDRRHLDETRRWANEPALMRQLDRAWPVGDAEHEEWFAALAGCRDRLYFAVEALEDRAHLGNAWLFDIDWRHRRAELRIVIGNPAAQGRGVGTESIDLLSTYAFERLNLHKIVAYVLDSNPRARRAFEKAAFAVEGTLKEDRWAGDAYVDVHVLGRRR
jgi:RimJ/RimL family protein N-acetyltransferase